MYEITVTHTAASFSVSAEYQPQHFHAETPEAAAVLFQKEIEPARLDLSRAVERLADGKQLEHLDRDSGRTVIAKQLGAVS